MSRVNLVRLLLWSLFGVLVLIAALRGVLRDGREAPEAVLQKVPPFTLVDQEGESFGGADLSGSPYVANFFFTTCRSICPALMQSMAELEARYRAEGIEGVHFVSFSVDPETDTPERMKTYARELGIDLSRWSLLTGDTGRMRELLMGGFRVPMGEAELVGGLIDIAHSGKFVLVDGEGRIQGYYSYVAPGPDELFQASVKLLAPSTR
jgi:protein SCO1/2